MSSRRRDDDAPDPSDGASDDRDAVEVLVEEFFERRRRGESSDADEFARRVPGREAQFKRMVATLSVLEAAAAASATRSAADGGMKGRERLGRFRLLRLVGRGGMGAVYEAIDEELDRRVALKILPGRATLDERGIARFRREAQAAARLSHPHIVPIFGVGEDDGAHWLAMQFITGESLDQVLSRMREGGGARLAANDVARHGLEVAEALVHAHAEGVLHRDVKPSNLLLDASGTLWVTDFGLAKSEGTASITRTGEMVGTPRYMAPEAFSGWADPRTDVWGVGATLYELLAGRPAFDGNDRAQLLKQISAVEPPPLTRVDPTIPADLATIVHKCLQKEARARYGSAQELADDLNRFRAGEAIRARPPSLTYRIGLIGRRHPTATTLLAVALASGVVMTSLEAARAHAAERRAQRRFDDVRKLAGSFLFEFHDAIRNLPGSTAARALVVKRALEYLDGLAAESAHDSGLRRELATAYQKVGDVQGNPYQPNLGDTAGARKSYQTAIDLLEPAVAARDASDDDRAVLAAAFLTAGGIELGAGDAKHAIELTEKGLQLRRELASSHPDPTRRLELATAWQYLAFDRLALGRSAEASDALNEQAALLRGLLATAPDDPMLRRGWGQNRFLVAQAFEEKGDHAAARTALVDVVELQRALCAADPGNTVLRRDLAWSLTNLGGVLDLTGEMTAALGLHRETLAMHQSLAAADPENVDARVSVATAQNNLGNDLVHLKRPDEALEHLAEAISICESVVAADPSNSFGDRVLASACTNAAAANAALGDPAGLDSACDLYQRAIAIFERMKAEGRLPPRGDPNFASARAGLKACEARIGKHEE